METLSIDRPNAFREQTETLAPLAAPETLPDVEQAEIDKTFEELVGRIETVQVDASAERAKYNRSNDACNMKLHS